MAGLFEDGDYPNAAERAAPPAGDVVPPRGRGVKVKLRRARRTRLEISVDSVAALSLSDLVVFSKTLSSKHPDVAQFLKNGLLGLQSPAHEA